MVYGSNAALTKELRDVNRAADELKKKNSALVEENKNLSRALSKEIGEGIPLTHSHIYAVADLS